MTISEAFVADFELEVENTRKVLAAVPDDKLGWKPHDKSMTLGKLAGHVAEIPSWIGAMMEDELDFATIEWKPYVATSRAEMLAKFDDCVEAAKQAMSGKDDAFLQTMWTARAGDQVVMQMPKHTAIRTTLIHHAVHHRGQLTVYLRLLDVAVPGTYGPTADEEGGF